MLPRGDEYNQAVQNPRIAFSDSDLKSCQVETTPLGLPKPYSGGFTITYKLANTQNGWAVRCFHRDIQDLQRRYEAITTFFAKNNSQYFIQAKYLDRGINVNGNAHPIIKMQWLDGEPLNIYLSKNYNQKTKIEKIIKDFVSLINELENFGIAHGDLQHGNIIVKNEKLFLIDYDGMYFPELASLKTNEIGHINYQHPNRSSSHYNQYIDRFSAIIIYIGLTATSLNPLLWKKYDNSENLLFKSKDFADLHNSSLIHDLSTINEIKPLVDKLIGCCYLEFEKIPSLKDFLAGNFQYNKSAVGTISITRSQYKIINAVDKGNLLEHFGEKIEVIGKISGYYNGSTFNGSPYTFLNYGIFPNQTFTLVIWSEGITALSAKGISPTSLVGKWVSVTGVVGSYNSKPQMMIDLPTQIQVLAGEVEANQKLKQVAEILSTKKSIPTSSIKTTDKEADVFNTLYRNVTPSKSQTIKPSPTSPTPSKVTTTPYLNNNSSISKNPRNSSNTGCAIILITGIVGGGIGFGISQSPFGFIIGSIIALFFVAQFNK